MTKGGRDDLGDLHDSIDMVADKLLFDRCAFLEGVKDEVFHRKRF